MSSVLRDNDQAIVAQRPHADATEIIAGRPGDLEEHRSAAR